MRQKPQFAKQVDLDLFGNKITTKTRVVVESSKSPFFIEGPAIVSFSGGRTSGYMLRRILDEGLQPDVHILFANTGKERPETLDFVEEVSQRWAVPITWLEYERNFLPKQRSEDRILAARKARAAVGHENLYGEPQEEQGYRIVTHATAARNGEPFSNLIDLVALPSLTMRLCTAELKLRPIVKYMKAQGYEFWGNVVGIRFDEPKRITKMRSFYSSDYENELPLANARVVKADVLAFWRDQPFDLQLPLDENGDTYGGNCDLCFLKSTAKRVKIAREHPEWLDWWIQQEERTGMAFQMNGLKYIHLRELPPEDEACLIDDGIGDCNCTD